MNTCEQHSQLWHAGSAVHAMHMIADQLITPNMLADIDCALKKATRCEHDFGNWLVILSGDFFQINDDVQYHNHTANGARCP